MKHKILVLLFTLAFALPAFGQEAALKTNLLYDATGTINLGAEFALDDTWTLDISGNYNPWTFSGGRKMKHWLVQPEARYWLCEKFDGHFLGLHLHAGQFNWGGMLPWGFENTNIRQNRYQGWLAGAGLSYGYHWIWTDRWSMEFTLGLGYAYLDYDKYPCAPCGEKLKSGNRHYFGPTKAGISLIFILK